MALSGQWNRVVVAQDCRLRTLGSLVLHRSSKTGCSEGCDDTSLEFSMHRSYTLKRGFFSSFVCPSHLHNGFVVVDEPPAQPSLSLFVVRYGDD